MDRLNTPFKIIGLLFLVLALSFVLQLFLTNSITIAHITPNFLIIVVATSGFLIGKKMGIVTGFIAGLMMDVLSMNLLGLHALLFMLVGYFCGYFKRLFFVDRYWVSLIIIGLSNIFTGFCSYVFLFLLRGRLNLLYYLKRVILAEAIYTVVIAAFFFPLVRKVMLILDTMITDYMNSKR